MKFIGKWLPNALIATLPLFNVVSEEVVVNISGEERLVLDIQEEDSFLEVLRSIGQLAQQGELQSQNSLFNDQQNIVEDKLVRVDLLLSNSGIQASVVQYSKEPPRNYYLPLGQQEKDDISYIIKTMANSSLIKIAASSSSLKKAGDRVEHLHPFKFLYCIFSNEELKVCMRNLQGRSWVWKEFLNGIVGSFKKETAVGNVTLVQLQDFANSISVDVNLLIPSVQAQQWEQLVDVLIANAPRKGNYKRYDM